jgi:predicted Holliday junction resolvase-like endonuclease
VLHRRAEAIRARALTGARAALRGRIVEQITPLLGDFPYDPSDARFLGAPVDFVVFDGAAAEEEIEIVLVEVKSGRGRLSDVEVRVREAVEAGRVRYEVLRFE